MIASDPVTQRPLVHPKITRDLRDRLPGLGNDPNSSLTELPVVLVALLCHSTPYS